MSPNISNLLPTQRPMSEPAAPKLPSALQNTEAGAAQGGELRKVFDNFVGETFYGQMLHAMRETIHQSAYFHGGRAEEVFQGQLDQILAQQMTKASAHSFTGPMFDLFSLSRS